MLNRTSDFDMKTAGTGLMSTNAKFWGQDPQREQVDFLKQFDTMAKCKSAVQILKTVCLKVLSGVINHIAPAGKLSE